MQLFYVEYAMALKMIERGVTVRQAEHAMQKENPESKEQIQRKQVLYQDIENTFKNLWDPGVSLYSSTSANAPINVNFNIKILKNTFIKDSSSPYPPAIYVSKVRGAEIKNNIFKTSSEKILPPESAVKIYNSENIEVGQE